MRRHWLPPPLPLRLAGQLRLRLQHRMMPTRPSLLRASRLCLALQMRLKVLLLALRPSLRLPPPPSRLGRPALLALRLLALVNPSAAASRVCRLAARGRRISSTMTCCSR